jgi:hypothetical protein
LVDSKIIAITGILPFSALTISYLAEKRAGYILAARGREGKQRKRRVLIIGDSKSKGARHLGIDVSADLPSPCDLTMRDGLASL